LTCEGSENCSGEVGGLMSVIAPVVGLWLIAVPVFESFQPSLDARHPRAHTSERRRTCTKLNRKLRRTAPLSVCSPRAGRREKCDAPISRRDHKGRKREGQAIVMVSMICVSKESSRWKLLATCLSILS
jgi:hypothetical protein